MRRCENCKHFHKVPDNIPVELGDNYRNTLLMNSCDFIWGGWMAVCYDLAKGQKVCEHHRYKRKQAYADSELSGKCYEAAVRYVEALEKIQAENK